MDKVCVVCQKTYAVPPSRAATATTCSRACKAKESSDQYKEKRIKRSCLSCGKDIEVIPSRSEKGGRYCSYSCAHIGFSRQIHSTWADGNESPHSDGYVLVRVPMHPFNVKGVVLKHRLIMEDWMRDIAPDHKFLIEVDGMKYLRREIHVHHINEVKVDNGVGNLLACTAAAHKDIHNGDPVLAGEIFPDYDWIAKRDYRGVKRECQNCGKEFFASPSAVADGKAKNCSPKCQGEQRSKNRTVEVTCVCCGKRFNTCTSYIARGGGKFCSNACRHEARKGHSNSYVFPAQVLKSP